MEQGGGKFNRRKRGALQASGFGGRIRVPDATQREAVRRRAGTHVAAFWVPALRSSVAGRCYASP